MRRMIVLALALISGFVVTVPAVAHAAPTRCEGGSDPEGVIGVCEDPPSDPDGPAGPTDPDCVWAPLTYSQLTRALLGVDPNIQIGDGWRYYPGPGGRASREAPDGTVELGEIRQGCETGNGIFRFVGTDTPEPDPVDVAIASARRAVPVPELEISPGLGVGGIVNLGMWLAVADREPVSVTANGRGTSVTVTATLVTSEWNMGDGTTLDCDGGGVPIEPGSAAFDSVEEGPCGHTYTAASSRYAITVTTRWTVAWVATDGRTGTAPDIVRTATFDYAVREVQTVGTGG